MLLQSRPGAVSEGASVNFNVSVYNLVRANVSEVQVYAQSLARSLRLIYILFV